jgi:hypothetical protein
MIVGTTNAPLPTTAAFRMKSRRPLAATASRALASSLELAIPASWYTSWGLEPYG